MTTTSTFQGKYDDRNSSRVLRPPGGGGSDIFGTGPPGQAQAPQKQNKNHQSSNIFGGDVPASSKDGKVNERITKSNVFGPAEPAQSQPNKPRKQDASSDIFGPPEVKPAPTKKTQDGEDESDSDSEEGDKKENVEPVAKVQPQPIVKPPAGIRVQAHGYRQAKAVVNPITGEVVRPAPEEKENEKENEQRDNPITGDNAPASQPYHSSTRVRQPPGGASSKLW